MKVLLFNHHPDVTHYMWRAYTELGLVVDVATEALTKRVGFAYSSTKKEDGEQKFEVVNKLYAPEELFPDMKEVAFSDDNPKEYDLVWSMLPEVTQLNARGIKTWYDCQMNQVMRSDMIKKLPGIKTCNHPDAKDFGLEFCPNWVAPSNGGAKRKYIVQLITELNLVDTTEELKDLKDEGLPVKICGGDNCPDGFVRDIDILKETALLVHNKQFGINCYAVCKALDRGIPVYMSKETKKMIGFDDLPDWLFRLKEDMGIKEAFFSIKDKKRWDKHRWVRQNAYRKVYTLDRTVDAVKRILGENNLWTS
jgi:hypothetical protein